MPNTPNMIDQRITDTLEKNFMPYAMSVIISRAIPEIDGFKPSHRKLLYTMYKMGLLTGARTKSANVVGSTMKLNPHGDAAIYDTMVRLSKGHEALVLPYVDSKGNFGKQYSRDMAYAAARYTEVKLAPVCAELFRDIDKETVDLIDNYDNTQKEPALLPVSFPNVLVNANLGIAVGMASTICSFNLAEVCETTVEYLKDEGHNLLSTLKAPDFSTGGYLLYKDSELEKIYRTGRGAIRLRAKWRVDEKNRCVEITEIPYTTTVEAIMEKVIDLVKSGRLREISDIRDETDLSGLRLTIDLKRGVDAEKLMARLLKQTPLEDTFSCNFNVLLGSAPKVCGVRELLEEWTAFRIECLKRQMMFDMRTKEEKLHLLRGLNKILLDIDKAVAIIRETDEESEVVPNLMIGFGIDEVQAEFVADIRLRNLNREYILRHTKEIGRLEADIAELRDTIASREKIKKVIIRQLTEIKKKYGEPRKTEILYEDTLPEAEPAEETPDYPVNLFLTRDGYFKKITPLSLRMGGEQKLKEEDELRWTCETTNRAELLLFTDKAQVYKARLGDFEDTKASVLGDFLPGRLSMEPGESVLFAAVTTDYTGCAVFFFRDGHAVRVELAAYATKTNRKKLTGAYWNKSPLVHMETVTEGTPDFLLTASNGKLLVVSAAQIVQKTTRSSQGAVVMTVKGKNFVCRAERLPEDAPGMAVYRPRTLPSAGRFPEKPADALEGEQLTL